MSTAIVDKAATAATGGIITVLGSVEPARMGMFLAHEHVMCDFYRRGICRQTPLRFG